MNCKVSVCCVGLASLLLAGGPAGAESKRYDSVRSVPLVYANWSPERLDLRFRKQEVDLATTEAPGTVIVDTSRRFLYLVVGGGKALRYGIGVGRDGFRWRGVETVARKAEWPDWRPPEAMKSRDPTVPHFMKGGPGNPLGARALYLGETQFRIHGTPEPWTIGTAASSGCVTLTNEDVVDLYARVAVGAKVIVN